ncbi:MAG: glycosyl transferase family protein, partial [Gammaproteobacteria bacterium]|nr:glycosyl transferase family protein [Gammaproteobacteria bacterium]
MQEEHLFAPFVRILGKGKNGSRSLTEEEAFEAMSMIVKDEVEPEQLGAFLMLLRVKEETPEEVAGFVRAIRTNLDLPEGVHVDLDWSSYAGKRRHSPWYILSALLLADNGLKVCMHGAEGHTPGRMYTSEALAALGIKMCDTLKEAETALAETNFAYMPLQAMSEKLKYILELRPLLGLRSPIHTVGRMINPFSSDYSIQAIFHPGYQDVHQLASQILDQKHMAVFKGEAGEVERNPDTDCTVSYVHNKETSEEEWPAIFERRHVKEKELDAVNLISV